MIKKTIMRGIISTRVVLVILIITSASVILIALSIFVWLQTRPPNTSLGDNSSSFFSIFYGNKSSPVTPPISNGVASSTEVTSVALRGGGNMTVRNFLSDPDVSNVGTSTTDTTGYYIVSQPYPPEVVPDSDGSGSYYHLSYFPQDKSFLITILKEPVGDVRREAIADLSARIGVSGAELCSLVIEVGTPTWVNSFFGARSLGVPGCLGSVEISGDPKF